MMTAINPGINKKKTTNPVSKTTPIKGKRIKTKVTMTIIVARSPMMVLRNT
jgi:hypothetical protein